MGGWLTHGWDTIRGYADCFGPAKGPFLLVFVMLVPAMRGRVIQKKVGPGGGRVWLRLGTSDIMVFNSTFHEEGYAYHFAVEPQVIVDGGAYTGLTAIYFSRRFPNSRIYAIEPDPDNFELLKLNTSSAHNVEPIFAALWPHSGEVALHDPGQGAWARQVQLADPQGARTSTGQDGTSVEAISVADLMERHQLPSIDLLKLDIEGSERELFTGPVEWLDHVSAICIELHDRLKPGCSRAFFTAVANFPVESRRGETVLVARDEFAAAAV